MIYRFVFCYLGICLFNFASLASDLQTFELPVHQRQKISFKVNLDDRMIEFATRAIEPYLEYLILDEQKDLENFWNKSFSGELDLVVPGSAIILLGGKKAPLLKLLMGTLESNEIFISKNKTDYQIKIECERSLGYTPKVGFELENNWVSIISLKGEAILKLPKTSFDPVVKIAYLHTNIDLDFNLVIHPMKEVNVDWIGVRESFRVITNDGSEELKSIIY